jgi:hypothetical protein
MKKIVSAAAIIILSIQLAACAQSKVIDGVEYHPYGAFNADQHKNPKIEYELVFGNLVWTIILCETIIAPIYFLGYAIMQPVSNKIPEVERH